MEWYYADASDNQIGPVGEEQLKALVSGGKITGKTMVWQDGMNEWVPAETTELKSILPRTTGPLPGPAPRNIPPKLVAAGSFDRDDSKVYPQNPPRSAHLNWLNLLGPGLAQIVYGKVWMGVGGIALNTIISYMIQVQVWNEESPTLLVMLNFILLIASVVDGIMTAKMLQTGRPVGKWQFFPR